MGRPAPALAATDLDGKPVHLTDLKGRVVLLDFWATWCVPCVTAMPQLQSINDRFAERGLTVIGVNQDHGESARNITAFVRRVGVRYRHVLDPQAEIKRRFRVTGLPTLVLIDAKGMIRAVHVGAAHDSRQSLAEEIGRLLEQTSDR